MPGVSGGLHCGLSHRGGQGVQCTPCAWPTAAECAAISNTLITIAKNRTEVCNILSTVLDVTIYLNDFLILRKSYNECSECCGIVLRIEFTF